MYAPAYLQVMRAFWKGVATQIIIESTGVKRANYTRPAQVADVVAEDDVLVDARRSLRQQDDNSAAPAPSRATAPTESDINVDRDGDSRVVAHLYAQPPRPSSGYPYWKERHDENLLSSVYVLRITEGYWSSLSARELVEVEITFDANTALDEALVPVGNTTSLYYRCHQKMPVFNTSEQSAPTVWEDRQCRTSYPTQPGQPLTCTCTLPSMRDQNDRVEGFPDVMPWYMIAIRKTEGQCFSDEEYQLARSQGRLPVECSGSTRGQCQEVGAMNGRCVCAQQYWGSFCENDCPGCSGNGACDSDGDCQCYVAFAGPDCSVHPNISSVVPAFSAVLAAVNSQSILTVEGRGFGSSDSSPQLRVGNTLTKSAQWLSPTRIEAVLSAGTGEGLAIGVYAHGTSHTAILSLASFSYSAPVVTAIASSPHGQPHGPVSGGYQVTVLGSNFGVSDDQPKVRFMESECYPLVWTSDSSVVCFAPRGIGTDILVSVGVPNGMQSLWRTDAFFTYDRPRIRALSADTDKAYTYNFEGGEMLTVYGTNFDSASTVLIGKRPGRGYFDYDNWVEGKPLPLEGDLAAPSPWFYNCTVIGSFYTNITESADTCYEPPKVCSGGLADKEPCVGDIGEGGSCPGGVCTPDWCSAPEWWGARKRLDLFPEHCIDRTRETCASGEVACDPCSLMCQENSYTKYQSAHKVCSVELLKCELPAEGGRFNVMVELAGQESDWADCSDAVIECSKRTCTTVCQNGPRVGTSCTNGNSLVCQVCAVCRSVCMWQCAGVCCNLLQCVVPQWQQPCLSGLCCVLQCVCCSMLQFRAMCCSVSFTKGGILVYQVCVRQSFITKKKVWRGTT